MTTFARRVLAALQRIPAGSVITYGDLARLAGRAGAGRAVGNIMRAANVPGLPYHRVIAAGGRIGGYGGSEQLKAGLLAAEGHVVTRGRIKNFAAKQWRGRVARTGAAPARRRRP